MQWPPRALATGLTLSPGSSFLRTDMEQGNARQRRLSASVPERMNLSWRLKGVQMQAWRAWYKHQLLDGAAWFPCEVTDGADIVTANVRFVKPPEIRLEAGFIWTVTAEVEAEDIPLMTLEALETYLAS